MSDSSRPVLSLRGLVTTLRTPKGVFRAVDDVSFDVPAGGKVALVGESGSGKTMTALSVLRLVPGPAASVTGGRIEFKGRDLLSLSEKEMRHLRGNELSMVFQEPMTSLNPVLSVGFQITETLRAHRKISRSQARSLAVDLLGRVGIPSPSTRVDAYPHQLSGGMRQRVMMAIAMCCEPSLLIADEPTTALDVTIEAQILDLLDQLRRDKGTATLLITHDLGVVAGFAEQVVVMYAGQVFETAMVRDLFRAPAHPYTQALLQSLPPAPDSEDPGPRRLPVIEGRVPELVSLPSGCRFQDRCPKVMDVCRAQAPAWVELGEGRGARCHLLASEGKA
jgi:oligopeptide/dipeptide ABC transporter ATP-binding protein